MASGARTDLEPSRNSDEVTISLADAAALLNVHRATVADAKRILATRRQDIIDLVKSGELSVSGALKLPIQGSRLDQIASEIQFRLKRTVEDVIAIGKLLLEAKALTADPLCGYEGPNPDARFGEWVCRNLRDTGMVSNDTRTRFMNVARGQPGLGDH